MKSVMWIAAMSIVLNSTMIGSAQGEDPPEPPKKPAQKSIRAVEQERAAAEEQVKSAKEAMKEAKQAAIESQQTVIEFQEKVNAIPHYQQAIVELVSRGATQPHSSSGRVLVIPGEDTDSERIMAITEDLTVMSRILDKKLLEARMISGGGYGRAGYGGAIYGGRGAYAGYGYGGYGGYGVGTLFGGDGRRTAEGIYIDGYGALFLMRVGFPLSAPAETKEEKETEEPSDRIWEETRREIFTSPNVIKRRGIRLRSDREDKYDAEKVEDLKRGLIKSLRHAANIRTLEPDEWVILTVIGEGGLSGQVGGCGSCHHGDNTESEAGQNGCPSGTVMTVRVEKSDVDDFSEGELSFGEFREKVQIFTY